MGLFGRGKGFLGLSVRFNWIVASISSGLGILGIIYFILIGQYFSALGVLGVLLLILLETYRSK